MIGFLILALIQRIPVIGRVVDNKMEDYALLSHPKFKKQIEQAYKDSLEGKGTPLDEVIEETKKEIEGGGDVE